MFDQSSDLDILPNGSLLISGKTNSTNFPTTSESLNENKFNSTSNDYDIFILELDKNGSDIIYSTFLGGEDDDEITACAFDMNNIYVGGRTKSEQFMNGSNNINNNISGLYDCFIQCLNIQSNQLLSTILGGSKDEKITDLDIIGEKIIVIGYTNSSNFPVTTNAIYKSINGGFDCFITVYNSTNNDINFSSFFGGINNELPSKFIYQSPNIIFTGTYRVI